jgi:signal transduction histidine kinase
MNNPALLQQLRLLVSPILSGHHWRDHALITLVFVLLLSAQWFFLDSYWSNTLQPRLYQTAETRATVLAQAQAAGLVETLEHNQAEYLPRQLFSRLQEILVVIDPSTDERMMIGVALRIDYDMVRATVGSLDLQDGNMTCPDCFATSIALINHAGDLLGVADFRISDHYYRQLSGDMKARLFRESALVLLLLVLVWATLMVVFHRLHQAKRQIEASDRAKTRFMANVTHELRTPLNGILGYTRLFQENAELMKHHGKGIDTIDRCADHLLLMINDILDFSRVDENNLSLYPRNTELPAFLRALVEITAIRAQSKGIEFRCEFPQQLPIRVLVDDKRLRQVLLNLISNAIKFTHQGYVCFSVEIKSLAADSVILRFRVTDSGIGIQAAELQNIFLPFQQIDNDISRSEGSGLGLSISKELLQLMKAKLQVSSEFGQGSCFWFDLDLPRPDRELVVIQCLKNDTQNPAAGTLALPEEGLLQQLEQAARQHNILQLRAIQKQLAEDQGCAGFVAALNPFIDSYRLKPLLAWLDNIRSPDKTSNNP